jgi:hypothetical protein
MEELGRVVCPGPYLETAVAAQGIQRVGAPAQQARWLPAIAGGATREFVIPNSVCGIPSNVASYSMNVAVVPHGALGFLTLWPSGQPKPLVATLNSIDGRAKSNAAIVPAGSNGAVSVFATDTTDLILDINGYFVAGSFPGALAFYPLTPCRIADTRNPTDPLGGPSLEAQSTRSFPILASSCGVPPEAEAYSLNLAAVPKGPTLGYITVWPVGQSQPLVASLNDPTGTVLANAVIISAGPGGAVNVFTSDATDLVIDINGTFASPRSHWPGVPEPLKEVRGSQFKPGTARLIMELKRKAGYRIEEGPQGLTVLIDAPAGPAMAETSPVPKRPIAALPDLHKLLVDALEDAARVIGPAGE